ncbi:hypothetical protein ACRASX_05940 [Flavobacterium sp. TMP13]|uniref:hypothetical protein n=1 Tax=unclassified Flavobacterium TaxID=196869 RepID=UPI0008363F97|nr:hypothetical protein [Flavobacterium sp. TAB 87]
MKRRQLLLSFTLAMTVLFSILFQSIHSYEHLVTQLTEKECRHQYNNNNHTEVTHHHHSLEVCYVCHFAFSSYINPAEFVFQTLSFQNVTPYFFTSSETIFSFSGSMYAYRGPPAVV